jgi:hypothetical protein
LVNALSGLMHAAASALFFLILRRSRCATMAAVAATAFLSLSSLYWYYSEVAEVRALNDLLALGAGLLVFSLPEKPRLNHGIALGTVLGLGISHHPTYLLLLPAVLYFLNERHPKSACWAATALCAAAACAAPYCLLWLRLRGPAPLYNPDDVQTARDVLNLFLRKNTGGPMSFASGVPGVTIPMFEPARCLRELGWFGQLMLRDLMPAGLLLVLLGCVNLWNTQRRALIFWGLWILGTLLPVVFLSSQEVRTGDLDYLRAIVLRFYLLPMIGLFALAGFGADWLLSRTRRELGWALAAAAALCPLYWRPVNLSGADPVRSYAEDILHCSGPRDMILLTSDEANFSLVYMDLVEHRTQDRVFLFPALFSNEAYIARLKRAHPDLVLPREKDGLSHSVSRWMNANSSRPLEGEPTMRDELAQVSNGFFPQGVLVRLGTRFPPLDESANQAGEFLASSAAEKVPSWGLRPWTQEVYLLKAYSMILELDGAFLRRPQDEALRQRARRDLLAILAAR